MIKIDGRPIGPGADPYVIAEAGTNFFGNVDVGKQLIEAAADAGVDAVKFQTHRQEAEMVATEMEALGYGHIYDEMARQQLDVEDHRELKAHCDEHDVTFLSTPFSVEGVDVLADLGLEAVKIGSGELSNFHLLDAAAALEVPMIVSTGMHNFTEVREAVSFLEDRTNDLALLYCLSEYPAEPSALELGMMDRYREAFDVPVGFSDHTQGVEAPVVAMARGANVIEKHVTIDRRLPGGDQSVSLEPAELETVCRFAPVARAVEGDEKSVTDAEADIREWATHSLVTAAPVERGERLTEDNLTTKRPGIGVSARKYFDVLGATARESLSANHVLKESDYENGD